MAQEILVVDDEADIRTIIADTLQDEGYETRVAGDADFGVGGNSPAPSGPRVARYLA